MHLCPALVFQYLTDILMMSYLRALYRRRSFLVPYQVEQRGYAEVSVKSNVQKYISGQQLVKIHTHR